MSSKKNKNDSAKIKNNDLFMRSPADDEDIESIKSNANIDSFEFIMPLDYDETSNSDTLRLAENDDVAVMDLPDHNDIIHINESIENSDEVKPVKKSKPKKSKKLPQKEDTIKKAKEVKAKKENKPVTTGMFIFTICAKLILICSIVAVLIAAVYSLTSPMIAKNESAKKEAALAEIFPEMSSFEVIYCQNADINELYLVKKDDSVIGYCASVAPKGYGGEIGLMVGIGTDRSIVNIKVLSHAETPGYGASLLSGDYIENSGYIGFNGEEAVLGTDVDTYSGATRTTKALNNGVNAALSVYDEYILPYVEAIEPVIVLSPEEIEENAVENAYGWVTEEHRAIISAVLEHNFNEIYGIKVTDPVEGEVDGGFAAVVTVENETSSAKLLVTTWFRTINSIEVLEFENEGFAELEDNKELMGEIKRHINSGIDPEGETFSAEGYAVYQKALEVLEFYPTYLEIISASEEGGTVNE